MNEGQWLLDRPVKLGDDNGRAGVALMSAAGGEELLQQRRGAGLADAAIHVRRMMAGWLAEQPRPVLDGTAFCVGRAKIEPADAGEGDGRGAHGARLERHIEIAIDKPLAAELGASRADRKQLGMSGRIAGAKRPVAGARQHLAFRAHHHGADRDLAARARGLSLSKGQIHGPLAWARHICKLLPHHG